MSVAVCTRNSSTYAFESIFKQPQQFIPAATNPQEDMLKEAEEAERPPGQFDIWTSIQAQKKEVQKQNVDAPYVHPLMRRSSSLLSQKSLETCTESLGSETGSEDFFSSDDEADFFSSKNDTKQDFDQKQEHDSKVEFRKLSTVNYPCSVSRKSSAPRSFPPPLPSISRRDGPCLQMRPHRRDGRLVVKAVTVPSQNYLHAERQNGRLLLSFVNTTSSLRNAETETEPEMKEQEEEVITEEEEEVEVVDRGTIVEVKVSTQPQQLTGKAAAMKVHRSSIVINKFVSCMPVENADKIQESMPPVVSTKRSSATTTTAAAAAVAASSVSENVSADGGYSTTDSKLLFTSKRRNKEELLHDMWRCSELRKPLFIWEPCCIAMSS